MCLLQVCQDAAQAQLSMFSQMSRADAEGNEDLNLMEDKWSSALQDAAAVVQGKEAQLQLVTEYSQRTQAAKTTLERMMAEQDAVRM